MLWGTRPLGNTCAGFSITKRPCSSGLLGTLAVVLECESVEKAGITIAHSRSCLYVKRWKSYASVRPKGEKRHSVSLSIERRASDRVGEAMLFTRVSVGLR